MIIFRTGDCLDVFGAEPDESFDAFVSDWPAGVAFMGRAWDRAHGGRDAWVKVWAERAAMMRRKAKPGAYSLTWALPRTAHWTATALDDAGWQIQDVIVHVFGQGWPKGKSALKPASEHWILARNGSGGALQIDAARVARGDAIPLFDRPGAPGPIQPGALNPSKRNGETSSAGSWPPNFVLSHCLECEERGTRRVTSGTTYEPPADKERPGSIYNGKRAYQGRTLGYGVSGSEEVPAFDCLAACDCGLSVLAQAGGQPPRCTCGAAMWWACPVVEMDRQSGTLQSGFSAGFRGEVEQANAFDAKRNRINPDTVYADRGGASRFFPRFSYQAKAAGGERDAGCEKLFWRADKRSPFGFVRVTREEWERLDADDAHETIRRGRNEYQQPVRARGNVHPTVKTIALMEHLDALVTPPGGRLGDLTAGSGGTGIALHRLNVARGLGASFLGCDICPEAIEIAEARLQWWRAVRLDVKPVRHAEDSEAKQRDLFAGVRP